MTFELNRRLHVRCNVAEPKQSSPTRRLKLAARLRASGIMVVVFGIAASGFVYWLGNRAADLSANPATAGYYKAQNRQMEVMYGRMGTMVEDLWEDLKRPGIQATIIAVSSVLVAWGCFYFARLLRDAEQRRPNQTDYGASI